MSVIGRWIGACAAVALLTAATGCPKPKPTGPDDPPTPVPPSAPAEPPKFVPALTLPMLTGTDEGSLLDDLTVAIQQTGRYGATPKVSGLKVAPRVEQLTFTPDGAQLIAAAQIKLTATVEVYNGETVGGYWDGLKAWRMTDGGPLGLTREDDIYLGSRSANDKYTKLLVSPDGGRLWVAIALRGAFSSTDSKVYALPDRKYLNSVGFDATQFHPNGRWVLGVVDLLGGKRLEAVDAKTGKATEDFKIYPYADKPTKDYLHYSDYTRGAIAISPDGGWLAGASNEDPHSKPGALTVRVDSTTPGRKPFELTTPDGAAEWPTQVFYTADSQRVVVLSRPYYGPLETDRPDRLRAWDNSDHKMLWNVKLPAPARQIALSPDGHWVAVACGDKTVRLLSTATGEEKLVLTGHKGAVNAVVFSKDGKLLASADAETVRVWKADM